MRSQRGDQGAYVNQMGSAMRSTMLGRTKQGEGVGGVLGEGQSHLRVCSVDMY